MDNDDVGVGRLLTRREIIALVGMAGAASALHKVAAHEPDLGGQVVNLSPHPQCVVVPEQIEGPYFVDEKLHRVDIRTEPGSSTPKPGIALRLTFNVSEMSVSGGCVPLANAMVDVWQCDAGGIYSDVKDPRFQTIGQKFLRGFQRTDATGVARFVTIYPGWYRGRAVHLHFKIRTALAQAKNYEFTSQLYFDDSLTDKVHAREPYAQFGPRDRRNEADGIFKRGNGRQLIVALAETTDGVAGTFSVALSAVKPTTRPGWIE